MTPLPATDLRRNRRTWAVPAPALPALAVQMTQALPHEEFDRAFAGQDLETTYFDTPGFDLRKARLGKDRYLTLRIRNYQQGRAYALSAKTEESKLRIEISPRAAGLLLTASSIPPHAWADYLPGDLMARLLELAGDQPLEPVVAVCFTRYAVEDAEDRLTLDIGIRTDTAKAYPTAVLEWKSTAPDTPAPIPLSLRPIKLSKFLWATSP